MNHGPEISLSFNEAEALGLLDLVLLCPGELSIDQHRAALKLSDFCRQLIRSSRYPAISPESINPLNVTTGENEARAA